MDRNITDGIRRAVTHIQFGVSVRVTHLSSVHLCRPALGRPPVVAGDVRRLRCDSALLALALPGDRSDRRTLYSAQQGHARCAAPTGVRSILARGGSAWPLCALFDYPADPIPGAARSPPYGAPGHC